jgi:6-phosphofructokinase 1
VEDGKEVIRDISGEVIAKAARLGIDAVIVIGGDGSQKIGLGLVEVMGRDAGWIALHAGVAGGAHLILLPEIPFSVDRICRHIVEREAHGKRFTIVVVAEGIQLPRELKQLSRGGTVGNLVGDAIALAAHKEVRVSVLGHIQRGGSPSPFDRILATRFGVAAVDLIAQGGFGKMVCLRNAHIEAVDIADAIGQLKVVDPHADLVCTARSLGIGFGD